MSKTLFLREAITERLTAAAEEIFVTVENIVSEYQEEIERLRMLLGISTKPVITLQLHRTDPPLVSQPESTEEQQENQELPHIKEEDGYWTRQEMPHLPRLENKDELRLQENTGWDPHLPRLENKDEPRPQENTGWDPRHTSTTRDIEMDPDGGDPAESELTTEKAAPTYPCRCCTKRYKNIHDLNRHEQQHKTPYLQCRYCGLQYIREAALNKHERETHSANDKPVNPHAGKHRHACKVCGKIFSQKSSLKRHELVHKSQNM